MLKELNNYDWEEAFKYADKPDECPPNSDVPLDGFTREDVRRIIRMEEGCNDGDPWIGVFRLKDKRYAFLSAGCDYTGWG